MNDPQVWTLIGVFSAIMFAMFRFNNRTLMAQMDARFDTTNARIDATNARIDEQGARIEQQGARLDARIEEQGARLTEVMNARFADVDHRLSNLEDDMKLVKGHLIGQRSA